MSSLARRLTGRTWPSSAGIRFGAHRRASGECISVAARAGLQNAERSIAHSPLERDLRSGAGRFASGAGRCCLLQRARSLEGRGKRPAGAQVRKFHGAQALRLRIARIKKNRILHKSQERLAPFRGYTIAAVGLDLTSFLSTSIYDGCGLIRSMIFSMTASQQFCFDLYSCHAAEGQSGTRGVRGRGAQRGLAHLHKSAVLIEGDGPVPVRVGLNEHLVDLKS